MAFAGIFQPFARLRWIRFGFLMRAVNSRAAFPFRKQTLAPLPFANRTITSVACSALRENCSELSLARLMCLNRFSHFLHRARCSSRDIKPPFPQSAHLGDLGQRKSTMLDSVQ